jgi:hypothetical protein
MTDQLQSDDLLNKLIFSILELQGIQNANNAILHSLLSVICENAPELIDAIKEKVADVADLKISMNELTSEISKSAFETEIKQALLQFNLIKDSSLYSPTFIEVKPKK